MCGFFCIVGKISKNFDKNKFVKSSKLISQRGPDDFQTLYSNKFALSFYRLSLRDLSNNGRQPMRSLCGRYIICFNGEIYNSEEIKKKYLSNHKFKGTSDTEVLLEGFALKGEKIIDELEGMFAIFIYDLRKNKVFLIRDRFGIKPLYFHLTKKNEIIVSSEIKPIINFINYKSINYSALADFFSKEHWIITKLFLKELIL